LNKPSGWEGLLTRLRRKVSLEEKKKEIEVHNIKSGYKGERKNYKNKDT
jgi:hypothetical protein